MCGIFGIWNLDGKPVDLKAVQRAVNTLSHRGPDDEGYLLVNTQTGHMVQCGGRDTDPRLCLPNIESFFGEHFDFAMGHRRLAIIDLSPAGHQPMGSSDGRYWIVYNGEIYNYHDLRSQLKKKSAFRTNTDTEVVLAGCTHRQWEALHCFNGMWAFALWDHKEQCLFLTRDRFGIKPLFTSRTGNSFAFASEVKALVGKHGIPFQPDDHTIYQYLVVGTLPSPQSGDTFFKHVQSLPPGHWMRVRREKIDTRRYWFLPIDSSIATEATEAIDGLRELFIDAIRSHVHADVPVGTCLSGGVDSSSVVCTINHLMRQQGLPFEQIGERQKTFSAVYRMLGPYNEWPYIEKVLQATRAEGNFAFPSDDRLRNEIEQLVWHQDEPFESTSIFAQWCVMEAVRRRGVKVVLDGQGADECLAGYRPFWRFLADLIDKGEIWKALSEARHIQRITGIRGGPLLIRALLSRLPPSLIHSLKKNRLGRDVLNPDFAARYKNCEKISFRRPKNAKGWLNTNLHDLIEESSLPHLLRYEDRNSMTFGVEARVPFLDYRLVVFSFNAAADWRIHQGWTKWVLRRAMEGIVPEDVIWRKDKVGFETPERDWILSWMNSKPNILENASFSRDYLEWDVIWKKLASPEMKNLDTRQIWRWINLEIWLRVWGAL